MNTESQQLTITITNFDNAAMQDGDSEVARMLHDLANTILDRGLAAADDYPLRDINGNKVGVVATK